MRNQRGFSLVELLIAMTVFLIVLGGAMQALSHQSRGFSRGADEMGILQNLRYGAEQLDQDLRMAGANAPDRQPSLVYAGPNSFSYNADITSNVLGDPFAVYVDPDAGAGEVSAFPIGSATQIPASSPAFTYPLADFTPSAAETVIYWFSPDAETSRADDFVLNRRVNTRADEVLVRGVLRDSSGANFFKYYYLNETVVGAPTVDSVPTAWGPLAHTAPQHRVLPDIGNAARIDLLRAVEVRFMVTNNRAGTAERIRRITTTIPLPNVGAKKLQTCGDSPLFTSAITAIYDATDNKVIVTWPASVDEAAGEQDIIRYVIWRKLAAAALWGDPYFSLSSGSVNYSYDDVDIVPASQYQYAVSAQDCTPSLSAQRFSATVTIP